MATIACCQIEPAIGNLAENLERCEAALTGALALGADLVVLPELATSGYCFESPEEARPVALTAGAEEFARWRPLLNRHKAAAVVGFLEDGEERALFNSALLIDGSGVRACYRKTNLFGSEGRIFRPGSAPPPVVPLPFGDVGLLICYDLEFPDFVAQLAKRRPALIAVPANWPLTAAYSDGREPEIENARACAGGHSLAIACCDRSGVERGTRFVGGSSIFDATGTMLARAHGVECAVASIDLDGSL